MRGNLGDGSGDEAQVPTSSGAARRRNVRLRQTRRYNPYGRRGRRSSVAESRDELPLPIPHPTSQLDPLFFGSTFTSSHNTGVESHGGHILSSGASGEQEPVEGDLFGGVENELNRAVVGGLGDSSFGAGFEDFSEHLVGEGGNFDHANSEDIFAVPDTQLIGPANDAPITNTLFNAGISLNTSSLLDSDTLQASLTEETSSDLVVPGRKRKHKTNILNISIDSETLTPEGQSPVYKKLRIDSAVLETLQVGPTCDFCDTMFPNHRRNCSEMKVVRCKYLGCRWVGRQREQQVHAESCAYGNACGPELVELLKKTKFEAKQRLPTPDIDRSILPMFGSSKLAAIDFEIKDVLAMLKQHQHNNSPKPSSGSETSSSEDGEISFLVDLTSTLLIGQNPSTELFPANYQGSWTIYESGTANALGQTISVKVSANIGNNYRLFLTYSVNFHECITTDFHLGHLLLDGTKDPSGVIPHGYGSKVRQPDAEEILALVPQSNRNLYHATQIIVSTKPAPIHFSAPINMYEVILGKRKIGFRLFLFDSPPNEEILYEGKIPSAFSTDILALGNTPKINSTDNSPVAGSEGRSSSLLKQVFSRGNWPL